MIIVFEEFLIMGYIFRLIVIMNFGSFLDFRVGVIGRRCKDTALDGVEGYSFEDFVIGFFILGSFLFNGVYLRYIYLGEINVVCFFS